MRKTSKEIKQLCIDLEAVPQRWETAKHSASLSSSVTQELLAPINTLALLVSKESSPRMRKIAIQIGQMPLDEIEQAHAQALAREGKPLTSSEYTPAQLIVQAVHFSNQLLENDFTKLDFKEMTRLGHHLQKSALNSKINFTLLDNVIPQFVLWMEQVEKMYFTKLLQRAVSAHNGTPTVFTQEEMKEIVSHAQEKIELLRRQGVYPSTEVLKDAIAAGNLLWLSAEHTDPDTRDVVMAAYREYPLEALKMMVESRKKPPTASVKTALNFFDK